MRWIRRCASPLGRIIVTSDGKAVTGLWFEGQRRFCAEPEAERAGTPLPVLEEAGRWLDRYFSGEDPGPAPPLSLDGTAFSRTVWEELLLIPYGQTASYGEIAARAAARTGGRASPRAVGAAAGRNPVMLMVPCHRVIGADGTLRGYAGGEERKQWLLALERNGAR